MPDIKLLKDFARSESGAVYVWVALGIIALFGFGALAVDMSYLYVLRNQAQITADSAVLAGAGELPDVAAARAAAKDYANRNMSTKVHGTILTDSDIVVGNWDADTSTFVPNGADQNALRVTIRRSQANGNEVPTFLASVLGVSSVDVSTSAVAAIDSQSCFIDGILVRGAIRFDQGSLIEDGACVYGRQGINFDRDSTVEPGAYIGTLDPDNITYSQGFTGEPESIVTADLDHPLLDDVPGLVDDIENGTQSPKHINSVVVLNDLPATFEAGTAYVINGNVHIDKEIEVEDVLIAVRGDIHWGQNGAIVNATGTCPSGEAAIGIISTGNVQLDQSARAEGIQLITGGNFDLDQNSTFSGSAAIAGYAQIDQSPLISPCEDPFANPNSDGPRLVM
jgi:Flp pilus assembly protein TadG